MGAGLAYAREVRAEAVQVFASNPRGWATGVPDPEADAAFRRACASARIPVFVHAPYLVNLGSPSEATVTKSLAALRFALARGADLGARGIVAHAGSAVLGLGRTAAMARVREHLLPLLDALPEDGPRLLVEATAGGGESLASKVEDLGAYLSALDHHPRVGVCLDTCHAYAAGHDLAQPGGTRAVLTALVRAVGRDRLGLVHANDTRDPLGSRRDRHEGIGAGHIGAEPFAELFRHPAMAGVPVIVETPGGAAGHARDVALLKGLRER